jgi:hypothetical protein
MYTFNSLLILVAIIAVILFWYESLRVRESVTHMCRQICEKCNLQLLDQTVSLISIRIRRSASGYPFLYRVYQFEVSNNGVDRFSGYVAMSGRLVEAVQIDSNEGMTTIYPAAPAQIQ